MCRGVLFEWRESESELLRLDSTVRWVEAEG